MYIHLGHDTVVATDRIIGIFDLDNTTVSKITREYLARAERAGDVVPVTDELPKSFVLVRDPARASGQRLYLSQLSTATLLRRAEQDGFISG
ncbi:MAG: DUF370 domain-containing protein [Clostridia bacterium]|nr:DUF370 domain-containing protein [Clostridia bacterium]